MFYEINVSLNGVHYFATSERSITTHEKMLSVYQSLRAAFPPGDGFEISVTEWRRVGTAVNFAVDAPKRKAKK
jgi:hypothetical protein